jgi:hypothetical protein
MGWTYESKPFGKTAREHMRDKFTQAHVPGEKAGYTVLHDTADIRNYWAIVELTYPDGQKKIFCAVCLINHCRGYYNFGYKDMEEEMGPCDSIPPISFFRKLEGIIPPETVNDWARSWRDRCRAYYAKSERVKELKAGQVLKRHDGDYTLMRRYERKRGAWVVKCPDGAIVYLTRKQLCQSEIAS